MKNEIISKVNKIGNAGCIITNIAKVVLSISLVVSIVGAVVLTVMPKDFVTIKMAGDAVVAVDLTKVPVIDTQDFTRIEDFEKLGVEIESELEINGVEYGVVSTQQQDGVFSINAQAGEYTIDIGVFKWIMLLAAAYLVSTMVVLHFLNRLCKQFKTCETPFTEGIVAELRKLAIAIIPMAVISSMTESVAGSIMSGNLQFTVEIHIMIILLVLLIFMLAAIFSYGTMLQTESDETL